MVRDATLMAEGTLMDKEVVVMHGSEWQRWSISTNEWQPNLCDLEALNGRRNRKIRIYTRTREKKVIKCPIYREK